MEPFSVIFLGALETLFQDLNEFSSELNQPDSSRKERFPHSTLNRRVEQQGDLSDVLSCADGLQTTCAFQRMVVQPRSARALKMKEQCVLESS